VTLTFSQDTNKECFTVRIIDDDDYEATEEFFVNLTTSDTQVRLSPHFSVVVISDVDSEFCTRVLTESDLILPLCLLLCVFGTSRSLCRLGEPTVPS